MKITIVFKRPPYENNTNVNNNSQNIVVIKDPYTITMHDSGRKILGLDGTSITYEKYLVELKKIIHDTLCEQKLEQNDACDMLTIEDCKEPPNFAALLAELAKIKISTSSHCSIIFKNCSFGGPLYVSSVIDFINSVKKRNPNALFSMTLDEEQSESLLTEHDEAKLAALSNVIFFPNTESPAALPRFSDDLLIVTSKKMQLERSSANGNLANPSYFFTAKFTHKSSPSRLLLNFFSQAHQQQNDYTCGPAALQMIADYYTSLSRKTFCGQFVSELNVWQNLNAMMETPLAEKMKTTEEVGTEITDMRDELIKLGLEVMMINGLHADEHDEIFLKKHKEFLWNRFKEILGLGIPIMINMRAKDEIGHYQVAIGIDEKDNIIFAEPGSAITDAVIEFETIRKPQFIERWKNSSGKLHGCFLIIPPNKASSSAIAAILKEVAYFYNGKPQGNQQRVKRKLMPEMTWTEIEEEINKVPMIIVPLGPSQKEHAYHLPMNTDYIMAEYFRDRMLKEFPIMSTSTIDINYFPAFTQYPGSEHLDFETAVALVYQKCKCHMKHGITHIYIINMGISTNKVLEAVKEKFKEENANIIFNYTNQKIYDNVPEITSIQKQQRGTHAEELETSMMLYIKSNVVHMEKAVKDDNDEIDPNNPGPLTRNPNASYGVYSPSGAWGDPTLANLDKGKIVVEKYVELMRKEVKELLDDCLRRKKEATILPDDLNNNANNACKR